MSAHTRVVPGFPGYEVSEDGDVFAVGTNWRGYGRRKMRPRPNKDGYLRVRLTVGGERHRVAVHHAVALAFIGERPTPQHEVRHLNGDRQDNRAGNLAWGTRLDNARDRERHGRTSHGAYHSAAVRRGRDDAFDDAEINRARALREAGASYRDIAARIGRSDAGVRNALRGNP